jgi:hypothetical protein
MGVLSFGALVGSLVGNGTAGVFQPLIVALSPHTTPALQTGVGAGSAGSAGGGSGGPATITITTPAPSSPAASSGGSAGSSTSTSTTPTSTTPSTGLPPVKHVFLVLLSNQGYNQTFGHTILDPYLGQTLVKQGELIPNYYAIGPSPLSNEVALVSGQGFTPETAADCPAYKSILPGVPGPQGQVLGSGCVYPKDTESLASQLTAAHDTWKVYAENTAPAAAHDTAAHDARKVHAANASTSAGVQAETCRPKQGSSPPVPTAQDPYSSWRNPFLYFDSVVGKVQCPKENVGLGQLAKDLKSASTTPTFSYILPSLCDDGAVTCDPSAISPLARSDAFLKSIIPKIVRSPAYKDGGLIAITFDQAPQFGPNTDPSSCCDTISYPNDPGFGAGTGTTTTGTATTDTTTTGTTGTDTSTTTTTGTTTTGTTTTGTDTSGATTTGTSTTGTTTTSPASLGGGVTNPTGGGGQVGLLLISKYVTAGTQDTTDYFNHFSLLASLEKMFGLQRLGYAADVTLPVFGAAVFSNYSGG